MIYAYITGGGTKWVYNCLKKGGASKWFLGARIPYSTKDFDEILGGVPFDGKYVSERTACQLSVAAYTQATKLIDDTKCSPFECVGLGVTAKLKTKNQRKGRVNEIIIAKTISLGVNALKTYTKTYYLPSRFISRRMQEWLCAKYINNVVFSNKHDDCYSEVLLDRIEDMSPVTEDIVMYSGSFNPMHDSHKEIIKTSKELFPNHRFCLEVTTCNYNKGVIGPYEMYERYYNIDTCPEEMLFSNDSTFVQKAKTLNNLGWKNIIFPMGDDTYSKISSREKNILDKLGVKLLVFRREHDKLKDNHKVIHPESYNLEKPKKISSTEIRKMQFNNKPNECLELKQGGVIWKSRNVAVSVIIFDKQPYSSEKLYLVKRGKDMTHPGKWCFPCGYLDWDETLEEAAVREVYEETGFIITVDDLYFISIESEPSKFNQNVSIRYHVYNGEQLKKDPNHVADFGEVEQGNWIPLTNDVLDMAFDHAESFKKIKNTIKH